MVNITITIDDEAQKILEKRATKNLFTLREQIEDIVRKSAIRTKGAKSAHDIKVDDKLINIFSKDRRGRKRKN